MDTKHTDWNVVIKALTNCCDALDYCLARLDGYDHYDPIRRKVIVTLEAGRAAISRATGEA